MRALWCVVVVVAVLGARMREACADPARVIEAQATLERLRTQYEDALDRASWRAWSPAVRAAADTVTADAIALLDERPSLQRDVFGLLHDAGGAALGPWLRAQRTPPAELLGAYLRTHDDADLAAAALARDEVARVTVAQALVLERPTLAASLIADALRGSSVRLGDVCAVANALPAPLRAPLAQTVERTAQMEAFAECLALVASHPPLRASLLRRVDEALAAQSAPTRSSFAPGVELAWAVAAVALLAPSIPVGRSRSLAARLADPDIASPHVAAQMLLQVAPRLVRTHPAVTALDRFVDREALPRAHGTWLLRDARDLADALRPYDPAHTPNLPYAMRIRTASLVPGQPVWTSSLVGEAALLATGDRVAAVRAQLDTLDRNLARRVTDFDLAPDTAARWLEAIDRTARCADDVGCLRALLRDAVDETAARAAAMLGAQGLATLPDDDARALVRRLVMDAPHADIGGLAGLRLASSTWLARVVFARVEGCPPALVGLASMAQWSGAIVDDPETPWRRAFALRCRDAGRVGSLR